MTPGVRRVAFASAVVLAFFVLFEAGARLGGGALYPARRSLDALPGEPVPGEPNMVVDPDTGWRPRSGPQASFGIPGGTTVNRLGMRGPEVTVPKPAGERRVLLLGDSTVFGVLVRDEETFARRTEGALQARDPHIRVLDGAAPGWSSYQARRALETRLLATEPDLVVIATLWSDTQVGELPDAVRFRPVVPLLVKSHGYLLSREWVNHLVYGDGAEAVRVDLMPPDKMGGGPPGGPAGPAGPNQGAGPPIAMTTRVPLAEYRANLGAMVALAREHGAATAFLVLPCIKDPGTGKVGDFRDEYRDTLRDLARTTGSPLADTPLTFAGQTPSLFFDEVHPTGEGHRLIAEVLSASLSTWAAP